MRKFVFSEVEFRAFPDKHAEEEVEVVIISPSEVTYYSPTMEAYIPPTVAKFAELILREGAGCHLRAPVPFDGTFWFRSAYNRARCADRCSYRL